MAQPVNCSGAITVCSNSSLSNNSNGFGVQELLGSAAQGCLGGGEHQSAWYIFQINELTPPGSTIGFDINPIGNSDYDFAIYGPDPDCSNLQAPIRCSYAVGQTPTGLNETNPEFSEDDAVGNDGYVASLTVNPGETFLLMVDNFSSNNLGFNLNWTGTASSGLNCDICGTSANAGIDLNSCVNQQFSINVPAANGGIAPYTYKWSASVPGFTFNTNVQNPLITPPNNFTGEVIFTLTVEDSNNCIDADVTTVTIYPLLQTSQITASDNEICEGQTVNIIYNGEPPIPGINSLTFDFDGGTSNQISSTPITYEVTYFTTGNKTIKATFVPDLAICPSLPSLVNVNVLPNLNSPVLSCDNSVSGEITFNWNPIAGATNYSLTVTDFNGTTQSSTTAATSYVANNLLAGEIITITIEANNLNNCTSPSAQLFCMATNCIAPNNLVINANSTYCTNDTPTFSGTPTGGTFSGAGISTNGTFNPILAGIGAHLITYTYTDANACVFEVSKTITVNQSPDATFILPLSACLNIPTTLQYGGPAQVGVNYSWNFGVGATPATGNSAGPFNVTWDAPGNKTITLTSSKNGCITSTTKTINVVAKPQEPAVSCSSSSINDVTFSWDNPPNSTGFNLTIYVNGVQVDQINNYQQLSYTVNNLQPAQQVKIELVAIGIAPCLQSGIVSQICTATACNLPVSINVVDSVFCSANISVFFTASPFNPDVVVTGNGVSTVAGGYNFNANVAGVGNHLITLNWTDLNTGCQYTKTKTFVVNETPSAPFDLPLSACINSNVSPLYTGAEPPAMTYNWSFGAGSNPSVSALKQPGAIVYNSLGNKTVTLSTELNGCLSAPNSKTITIEQPLAAPLIICNGNSTSITFSWNNVAGANSYSANVFVNGTSVFNNLVTSPYTQSNLSPNDSVSIELSVLGNSCPATIATKYCFTDNCPLTPPTINNWTDSLFCENDPSFNLSAIPAGGDFIDDSGNTIFQFIPVNYADDQIHFITYQVINNGCLQSVTKQFKVSTLPVATFNIPTEECINNAVNVLFTGISPANATINWDFGNGATPATGSQAQNYLIQYNSSGNKTILLNIENGSCSTTSSKNINIENALQAPTILCVTSPNSITFSWNDVGGNGLYTYQIFKNGLPTNNGSTTDTFYVENNLQQGDDISINLIAQGLGVCGNSPLSIKQCSAESCPIINPSIQIVQTSFCVNDTQSYVLVGTPLNGTFTLNNQPISELIPANYNANTYTLQYTYIENSCTYSASQLITIYPLPSPTFSLSQNIVCENQSIDITYTGNTGINPTFNWDFGSNASLTPQTTEGPHTVSWSSEGVKNISLLLSENGCNNSNSETIQVVANTLSPIITCNPSTPNAVTFNWQNGVNWLPNTTFIISTTVNGQNSTNTTLIDEFTLTETNLQPNDEVIINIEVQGNPPCSNSTVVSQTCTATGCPALNLTINNLPDKICTDNLDIALEATPIGGTFTLNNNTISTFNPFNSGSGIFKFTYTLTQNGCSYTTQDSIEVIDYPTVSFNTNTDTICINNAITVQFNGSANTNATFDWNFGNNAQPAGASGNIPQNVSWTSGGTKDIILTVTNNICSNFAINNIVVEENIATPTIVCTTISSSEINFDWNNVPNAQTYHYEIFVPSMNLTINGDTTGTEYLLTNLLAGSEAFITLTAIGNCGNSSAANTSCVAQNCPNKNLNVFVPTLFCANDEGSYNLNANPTGGVFKIDGVVKTEIIPSELIAGNYNIQYIYTDTTTGCLYDTTITITNVGTVNLEFNLPDAVCKTDGNIPLLATPIGGDFILDNQIINNFNTNNYDQGLYVIEYTYTPNPQCPSLSISDTFDLNFINATGIKTGEPLSCEPGTFTLGFAGQTVGNTTFDWNFGANANPQTSIDDPVNVTWNLAGIKNVTLTVTVEACPSATIDTTFGANTILPPPNLFCLANADSIVFTWNLVPEAINYEFDVIKNGITVFDNLTTTDTFYVINNLNTNDEIELNLQTNVSVCNTISNVQTTCTINAIPCPTIALNLLNLDSVYCVNNDAVILTPNIDGINISGTCINNNEFTPSQTCLGVNNITLHYLDALTQCQYDTMLTTKVVDIPVATFNTITNACTNQPVNITFTGVASQDAIFNWDFSGANIVSQNPPNYIIQWSNSGSKNVSLIIEEGACTSESFTQNMVIQEIKTSVTPTQTTINQGDIANLSANIEIGTANSQLWTPKTTLSNDTALNVTASPSQTTTYTFTAIDNIGCTDSSSTTITVIPKQTIQNIINVPNAFSPNNDGINDVFKPIIEGNISSYTLKIYNRWGNLIFETNDLNEGWNGNYKTITQELDVFVYTIIYQFENSTIKTKKGNVTLIK